MSAVTIDQRVAQPHVRAVCDGRPPGQVWDRAVPATTSQPALVFSVDTAVELGPPQPGRYQVHVVKPGWTSGPTKTLPDVRSWSASLAVAVAETIQGRRPVGQLSRWVDERVLAKLTISCRQRRGPGGVGGQQPTHSRPAVLRSVHLQFPAPDAVEVSAHVHVDGRSSAFAFRLDVWYDRWLCTALELGPHDDEV